MALIPWLVLLRRRLMIKTLHSMSVVNSPTKKGCTNLLQRIGVVSQLFWQCRARENYGKLLKSLCEEEIAKLLPQKRSKKIQKSAHGWQNHGLIKSLRLVKFVHSLIWLIILLTPKFGCFLLLWKLLLVISSYTVLCCGYSSLSFQSFVLRHLVIAPRNTLKFG